MVCMDSTLTQRVFGLLPARLLRLLRGGQYEIDSPSALAGPQLCHDVAVDCFCREAMQQLQLCPVCWSAQSPELALGKADASPDRSFLHREYLIPKGMF